MPASSSPAFLSPSLLVSPFLARPLPSCVWSHPLTGSAYPFNRHDRAFIRPVSLFDDDEPFIPLTDDSILESSSLAIDGRSDAPKLNGEYDVSGGISRGIFNAPTNDASVSQVHVRDQPTEEEQSGEELFFDGLSYPVAALDWCTTRPDCTTKQENSAGVSDTHVCDAETDTHMRRVSTTFVDTFRMSSPYINAHQGLIFVIHIPGALLRERLFSSIMEDIALMRVVGIKLILVFGPHEVLNERLKEEGIYPAVANGMSVTDARTLQIVKELCGSMRFEVECALAKGGDEHAEHKKHQCSEWQLLFCPPSRYY